MTKPAFEFEEAEKILKFMPGNVYVYLLNSLKENLDEYIIQHLKTLMWKCDRSSFYEREMILELVRIMDIRIMTHILGGDEDLRKVYDRLKKLGLLY